MASFDNHIIYNFFDFENKTVNYKVIDDYLNSDHPVRIIYQIWDVCHMGRDAWTHIRPVLQQASKKSKIVLLLADWLKDKAEVNLSELDIEIHYINGIALITYHDLIYRKRCPRNITWTPHNSFLFLTGKWDKTNRFPLFKKLLDQSLLNNSIYSLYLPKSHEYSRFNSNPDFVSTKLAGHTPAIPYDHTMYQRTGFRLISETEYDTDLSHLYTQGDDPWLTEKTWLTILNKHPFIMAGQKGTLAKLKRLGYKTFEEYLPYKYDDADNVSRLDLIVENVKYLTENIKNHHDMLYDIEFNYRHFCAQTETDLSVISDIIKRHDLNCDIRDIITAQF